MPHRMPGETIQQFAIRTAWETGHFWNPDNPEGLNVTQKDLSLLDPHDPVVINAMISYSKMDAARYTKHVLNEHGRMPNFDGEIGPAMQAMIEDPMGRCPVPDYSPPLGVSFAFQDPDLQAVVQQMQHDVSLPAVGTGNWKRCHGVGEFHSAAIGVNPANMPDFLSPLFNRVLKNVQRAYAQTGLLFRFIGQNSKDILNGEEFSGNINSDMSFVRASDGWIGLAILGNGQSCSSRIWNKYLATYRGGSTDEAIVQQWTTLVKHELGHNCGRNHTSGGVMNPSIVNGLPVEWNDADPSTAWLKGQFGGVPVPIPGDVPQPPPIPDPPKTVEQRLHALEVKNIVQDVTLQWCVEKIRKIGS